MRAQGKDPWMPTHPPTTQDWQDRHRSALAQEKAIDFDRFTYPDAWALGSRLVETATRHGYPVAIGINFGQQRVFHAALEGAAATNDDWLARKFRAVYTHNCSSWALECLVRATGEDYHRVYGYRTEDIAVAGGAVPLRVRGSLIGAVGVSGLASEEDHQLVVAALSALRS
jgi:uncharacterized protein (UPF0303 family)